MILQPPTSLSPSKVVSFRDCALAFRFSAIDRLMQPATFATFKGTIVHRALERLIAEIEPKDRALATAQALASEAFTEVSASENCEHLLADESAIAKLKSEINSLVENYFKIEDPTRVRAIGLELKLEAEVGSLRLRGIIDRLDIDDDGNLIVIDYKTGKPPSDRDNRSKLTGLNAYAVLCETVFGRRPAKVRLLHLKEPITIDFQPTQRSVDDVTRTTSAMWKTILRACETGDFRPNPSRLCDWCAFQQWCPAFGGDPELAKIQFGTADAEAHSRI